MSSIEFLSRQPTKILIAGGAYGGLAVATNLLELCAGRQSRQPFETPSSGLNVPVDITVVDERDGFYHLIGSPLALADSTYAARAWQRYEDIAAFQQQPNLRFLHGSVESIDCQLKAATIRLHNGTASTQQYDYFVAATGLRRVWPTVPQALTRRAYLAEAEEHIDQVHNAAEHGVVVIGGGAVGIEMAAELKLVAPHTNVTLIHSREKLLSSEPVSDEYRDKVLEMLQETGVQTVIGRRVVDTVPSSAAAGSSHTTIKLSDGSELCAGHVISAVSKQTSTASYLPEQVVSEEGLVNITPALHFDASSACPKLPNTECHFATGDLVNRPGIKRCGGAMYTGNIAAWNIYNQILYSQHLISEPVSQTYPEHGPSLVLLLGKKAVGYSEDRGGVMASDDLCKLFFEDDVGLGICWRHLGLGEAPGMEVRADSPREL